MKTKTTTIYQTSDGTNWNDAVRAQQHEVGLLCSELRPEGAQRLTASELVRLMCDSPGRFIALLAQFGEPVPTDDVAAEVEPDQTAGLADAPEATDTDPSSTVGVGAADVGESADENSAKPAKASRSKK